MLEQLQDVFRSVFRNKKLVIGPETSAKDIKMWDSLMHMELIATVESTFKIVFTFNEVMSLTNVGDMLQLIESKTKK